MKKAVEEFSSHVQRKGLNRSWKRDVILKIFLRSKTHVSAEELHAKVVKEHPRLGYTTVYRTLKLMAESGLAEAVDFDDGVKRFEPRLGKEFHAHLICSRCGKHVEVTSPKIKSLTLNLAKRNRFSPQKQSFEIFGLCARCLKAAS